MVTERTSRLSWLSEYAVVIGWAVVVIAIAVVAGLLAGWLVPFVVLAGLVTAAAAAAAASFATRQEPNAASTVAPAPALTAAAAAAAARDGDSSEPDYSARLDRETERLSHPDGRVRLLAVRRLVSLAQHPGPAREMIPDVLLEHLRQRSQEAGDTMRLSTDVQAAVDGLLLLRGMDYRRPRALNLAGLRLRGIDLMEADLTDANLDSADLTKADLRRADLRGALLVDATLTGAYIEGADLREARYDPPTLNSAIGDARTGSEES
jgi:hypothetical protein